MNRSLLRACLGAALTLAACNCGEENLASRHKPEVVIEQPQPFAAFGSEETVTLRAKATSRGRLDSLVLSVGNHAFAPCEAGADTKGELVCEVTFVPGDHDSEKRNERLLLKAVAAAGRETAEAKLEIFVRPAKTEIVIVEPEAGSTIVAGDPVAFKATAETPVGLKWLALYVGDAEIHRCHADEEEPFALACEKSFLINDHSTQIAGQSVVLTARTENRRGFEDSESVEVIVRPIKVRFRQPPVTMNNPPRAVVRGTSPLELQVISAIPVIDLEVRYGDEQQLMYKKSSPPFLTTINWGLVLQTGEHRLVAYARDEKGNLDQTELLVRVICNSDSDCGGATRCCAETGTCHPIVASGALCDCQNPCPFSEGCFTGTCGQTPRRCRPGCSPGTFEPWPGIKADRCTNQDGSPAYCQVLPAGERTAENKGGACSPTDLCDIESQNCPNLPLDRTRAAGPDNPTVPHNCVAASPTQNKCIPAGPKTVGATNCLQQSCGEDVTQTGCAKGSMCLVDVDSQGRPVSPPTCRQLCKNPNNFSRGTCPSGHVCAKSLIGTGGEEYQQGICRR